MSSRMDANHAGPEFWSLLGPEWSDNKVQNCAGGKGRAHLRRLLGQQSERTLEFAAGFLRRGAIPTLSRDHLYAALIYTHGDIKNDPPCKICASPDTAIFAECLSLSDVAKEACAAAVYAGKTKECDYHEENRESTVPGSRKTDTATHIEDRDLEEVDSGDDWSVIARPQRRRNAQTQANDPEDIMDCQPSTNSSLKSRHLRAPKRSMTGQDQAKKKRIVQIDQADTSAQIPFRHRGMASPELGPEINSTNARIDISPENAANLGEQGRQPRTGESIQDDLAYLGGNFNYAAVERAIEITPDMKQEANLERMIQVGPYVLSRFVVETDGMWASRIAAARRAWSVKMGENTD